MTEKKYVPKTIYRRGEAYAHTISEYIRAILDPEREFMMTRLRRALVCAMREMITAREAQCLELYYVQGFNYRQISSQLHINVSTISRNIQRGERKLNRILDLARPSWARTSPPPNQSPSPIRRGAFLCVRFLT